ncbi:MAG: zf-TFIIB domain-containing protein [Chloroflexi bacterium]|nr:zf-TFIIB domain-containing protein [Chloroflexota bacterium]
MASAARPAHSGLEPHPGDAQLHPADGTAEGHHALSRRRRRTPDGGQGIEIDSCPHCRGIWLGDPSDFE